MVQEWQTINTFSPPAFVDVVPSAGASDDDGVGGDPENLKKKTAVVAI